MLIDVEEMRANEIANDAVGAIFADLRDRRFLKWLFPSDPENCGPIMHNSRGEPLDPLDREVQEDIADAWKQCIRDALSKNHFPLRDEPEKL